MVEIVEVLLWTIRIVKMKDHLVFYREFSIFCVGDGVAVDRVVYL